MVLAVLLARANSVIGQDALIEDVWAGEPPEAARQTLHAYVSTLRKALGGQIERDGDGYLLEVDRSSLDSFRFEDLVDRARRTVEIAPAEALALLQEALGMWRGRAFGDLDGEPALVNDVIRLEEARLFALEVRIEADLVLGNHAAVVQELEALTREHPFRERLRAALVLALYRSGRQADALRAYQQTRSFLGEELGIDPTHELQELEERILNQDPALDWRPVAGESTRAGRAARGYELREELGASRFGTVFRGFQESVGREVTVLVIDVEAAHAPRFIRRFEPEMQAVSRLEHPHIAPIYDFWRDPEGAFLVTPFPAGGTLRQSLEPGPWNLSSTMRLVDQMSSALSYAHRNGVIHGALGVDNVVLDADSNVYIVEFGLIDIAGPDPTGDHSPALDVHDLASLAFNALTGAASASGARISETRPDLIGLDHVFQRALHTDPGSRFQKPEDFRRALRQVAGGDVVTPSPDIRSEVERRNPYKGLRAFHESDAADFHGRDALIAELVETVAATRLVTVVGPSGSGKSSLVRAGLIPALRSDGIPGSRNWPVTEMFPGTHPFEELEAALVRVAMDRPPGFFEDLTHDERGLARVAKQILSGDDDELLLVVDQFEELFSLVASETVRTQFLAALVAAATDERSRVRIALTLRADFFDQPLRYSEFAEVMRLDVVPVGPPTEDGLARAIAQPARDVGVDLEPGLVTRIVEDVKDEPGGMPLMQYALTELFSAREHNTLTLDAYHRTGGVLGALGRRAEEIYQDLSDDGKEATRQLFLRLVTVDELADDTRRRVRQTELRSLGINPTVLDDVLQQFGSYRLLSFDRDAATRTPTVEVAHEALIREWDRLRMWVDERREDLLIHRRIQVAVRDWEDSGKDPSDLIRGSRLDQALVWQERTDIVISDEEMTFIEAGIEAEKQEEAERQALEERAARRRKAVIGVLAGGLVVAGVLGALALDRARAERMAAAEAFAQELSAAAMLAVEEDPELGVLLALEALEATEDLRLDPIPEAISAVRNTQRHLRVEAVIPGGHQALAISPDGKRIVTDEPEEELTGARVWETDTGEALGTLAGPEETTGRPSFIAFSPTGETIAVARRYLATAASTAVDLYDATNLRHLRSLTAEPASFNTNPSFSSSGLVASVGNRASVWDQSTGRVVASYGSDTIVWWAEFIPGTDLLVLAHGAGISRDGDELPGRIEAIDMTTEETMWSIETPGIDPEWMSISPDGSMAAVANFSARLVQVMSIPDGKLVFSTPHQAPQELAWGPDSSLLGVSGNNADVNIFDVDAREDAFTLSGHTASVLSLAFHPDGKRLASASIEGATRIWSLDAAGAGADTAVSTGGVPAFQWLESSGDRMLVTMNEADAKLIDLATGSVLAEVPLHHAWPDSFPVPSETLGEVGGLSEDGIGVVLNAASGEEIAELPTCLIPRGLSPDGNIAVADAAWLCEGSRSSQVIDVNTGEMLVDLGEGFVVVGVFSPLGAELPGYVAVNIDSQGHRLQVYSLDDWTLIGELESGQVGLETGFLGIDTDASGRYLGLGTNSSRALVVDMAEVLGGTPMEDAVIFNVEAHNSNTPIVEVTGSGEAISIGHDGFYRAWNVQSGEMMWEIRVEGLTDPPSARLSWDETELAYEDAGGVIRFTPLDNEVVIERARAALTRNLTDDECRQYLHTDGCKPET